MAIETRTITTYKCDRCGHETEDYLDRGRSVTANIQFGARAHNGDTGGSTHRYWWCTTCFNSFANWQARTGD